MATCPDDERAHNLMGAVHFGRQEYPEAVAECEKANAINPAFSQPYNQKGYAYRFLGQHGKAKLAAIARNDGERRQAHLWAAMSYVHEGATDPALAELEKMAAIDKAAGELVALSGVTAQMGNVLLEAGRVDAAVDKYRERTRIIDEANVAAQVKEGARRQALFDEARVALARSDVGSAKGKAAAYSKAVTAKGIPFEVRQGHELAGRIALAEKDYATAAAELRQATSRTLVSSTSPPSLSRGKATRGPQRSWRPRRRSGTASQTPTASCGARPGRSSRGRLEPRAPTRTEPSRRVSCVPTTVTVVPAPAT